MESLLSILRTSFVALIAAQIAILVLRFFSCEAKSELLRFGGFTLLLGLRIILPRESPLAPLIAIPMIWAAGDFSIAASKKGMASAWGLLNAFFFAVFIAASLSAYRATLPLISFRVFFIGGLGIFSVIGIFRLSCRRKSVPLGLAAGSGALLLITASMESIFGFIGKPSLDLGIWPACLLCCCTAYMLFQEGYFNKGWHGIRAGGALRDETLLRDLYARLLGTENALVVQDRLIASGLIALGAAHEFKNALSHIRTTAESGLSRREPEGKDESLRLLAEHAEAGAGAAVDFLERSAREGREKPSSLDLEILLRSFTRLVRSTFRPEGILFTLTLEQRVHAFARKREVEQVLLNLVRNAVEAFRGGKCRGEKTICLSARSFESNAIIELSDNAGGLSPENAAGLFDAFPTLGPGGGLGLYLSKSLAERNGGSLSLIAGYGGSCFRLALPLAAE